MRVLICGDRHWADDASIRWHLQQLHEQYPDLEVIEGGATGADSIAGEIAREMGLTVYEYPAKWATYGKAAGPVRNAEMLVDGKPDLVLAFHDNLSTSRGTRDMVQRARKAGVPVEVIGENKPPVFGQP